MKKQIVKNTLSSSYPNHEQSHSSTKLPMAAPLPYIYKIKNKEVQWKKLKIENAQTSHILSAQTSVSDLPQCTHTPKIQSTQTIDKLIIVRGQMRTTWGKPNYSMRWQWRAVLFRGLIPSPSSLQNAKAMVKQPTNSRVSDEFGEWRV